MLRSAAKAILSKTLQRILSNYLLNVDITSISLTSLKGWGFQLQNVKLRNGAILFQYTTIKKKKKKMKRLQERKNNSTFNDNDNNNHGNSFDDDDDDVSTSKTRQKNEKNNNDDGDGDDDDDDDDYRSIFDESSTNNDGISCSPPTPPPSSKICFLSLGGSTATPAKTAQHKEKYDIIDNIQKPILSNDGSISHSSNSSSVSSIIEDDEEDEEEEEYEVIVKIGEGGGIGDLSIQLKDQKLYIIIKDAFLVLEVDIVPTIKPKKSTKTSTAEENEQTTNTATDPKTSTTTTSKKEENTKPFMDDIVEKMNGIFSSLPYVTLDNCLVRVVLATTGTNHQDQESEDDMNDATTLKKKVVEEKNPKEDDKSATTALREDGNTTVTLEIGIGLLSINDSMASTNEEEDTNDSTNTNNTNNSKLVKSYSELDITNTIYNATDQPPPYLKRSASDTTTSTTTTATSTKQKQSLASSAVNNNENVVYKHLYTGATYATGIYMTMIQQNPMQPNIKDHNDWAYSIWKSKTKFYFVHLSGFHFYVRTTIDHHKITTTSDSSSALSTTTRSTPHALDKKEQKQPVTTTTTSTGWSDYDELLDDYTMDTMLFGVDCVAAFAYSNHKQHDTNTTATPTEEQQSSHANDEIESSSPDAGVIDDTTTNEKDCYESNYHKYYKQGMKRNVTSDPLSNDDSSWVYHSSASKTSSLLNNNHKTSSSPDILLQVTITNPLEFNIDQYTLEQFGTIIDCFSTNENDNAVQEATVDSNQNAIILLGIQCSQMTLRVQHTFSTTQTYYSFGYYEFLLKNLLLDVHMHQDSESLSSLFTDGIFVIQSINMHQDKGIVRSNDVLVLQQLTDDDDNLDGCSCSTATTTASAILNISYNDHDNTTTVMEEGSNNNYAFQLRLVHCASNHNNPTIDSKSTTITMKLASISINAPYTIIHNIQLTIQDIILSVFPNNQTAQITTSSPDDDDDKYDHMNDNLSFSSLLSKQIEPPSPPKRSIDFHLVIHQKGNANLYPNIHISYPFFHITGTIHLPSANYTIQSMLNQVQFNFQSGGTHPNDTTTPSAFEFGKLPLDIRMRIFLLLDDVTSLEQAFGMRLRRKKKKESTSTFIRFHLLNMRISSLVESTTAATTIMS